MRRSTRVSRSFAAAALALLAALLLGASCATQQPRAWELEPPPPTDAPIVDSNRLLRSTLPNGLSVLVLEDPRLPRVRLGLTARGGAGLEAPEELGAATFTAELMERGAGERDALALAGAVDRLGASLSVAADWDATTVTVSGLSRDLDTLFEVLTDVVRRPRFAPEEADRVRAELTAALESEKDDPGELARRAFARALYAEHRYGLPLPGSEQGIARLGPSQARAFHARIFTPGNSILFASGDVSAQAILEHARAAFGDWPAGPAIQAGPPPPAQVPAARKVVIVDRPDLGQAQIRVGHEGLARTDPARIETSIMNVVLGGGGFSSRLMARVRADEGLTYGVSSGFALRRHPGPFGIATFTRVPEAGRVVGMLLEELERIASEPPTPKELANARSLAAGRFALGLETSAAVAASLVDLEVYDLPEDSLDTYRRRVRAVSGEDAARAARERLHPERAAIVVVGPAEALRPQLERYGPIEVVTP